MKGKIEMELTEGIYTLEGNKFYVDGKKFAVLERKKDTHKKPKNYLALLSPFQYISSLFPAGEGEKYNLDFQQELFELELNRKEGRAVLKKIEPIE